ncbi:hypothetical protein A5747_07375 [Mycobacterium sp. IS-836]|uniref:PPE family protein n=1 Tax=Mycobacterium sp. IS-836 TaxID=1834160 RepID=UPI00096CE221|nr:PPE family protein [Mycobacterium sp. IS-836]OMC56593.1 hypothetical protein A5747_07375 [Mycobacterium sp. IS-836]
MIEFGALPPEINSARMYAGPGPISLAAAAVAWDNLAAELNSAASAYRSVIAGLTTTRWMGPSSLTMASAFAPYVAWTTGAAARAAETASHALLAVEVYEAAFAMTVPPPAVTANRVQLAILIATNFFGQNSAAIAATEAEYGEMWAQDAAAMYQYAANSAIACEVTPFTPAPQTTNPAGFAEQAAAVTQASGISGTSQANLASVVTSVPTALQSLASPATSSTSTFASTAATAATTTAASTASSDISNLVASNMPAWLMAAATPVYAMSSIIGMAASGQGLASGAASAAGAAGAAAAQGAAAGASAAAAGAGALGSLGPGALGSLGTAASLGPLSVPASWTSVIPAAHMSTAAALPAGLGAPPVPPSILGSLPRAAASGKSLGPRYGVIPTVMTRPPAAGYV